MTGLADTHATDSATRVRWLARGLGCAAALAAAAGMALEPPRPGELDALRAQGLFAQQLAAARALSNDVTDAVLVKHLYNKLARAQGLPGEPEARAKISANFRSIGTNKVLILLAGFRDYTNAVSATTVSNMCFGSGTAGQYPRESLRNYYERASYGNLVIEGAVLGWYICTNNRSYYDGSNLRVIREIVEHYDAAGHDFSQYDNDGDGDIDYFALFWTGPVGAWASFWWGYKTSLGGALVKDGVSFKDYTWQWESSSPVVLLHETGHMLGLPDYYDYDDTVGPRGGVGGLDMMHGNYADHNGFSKYLLDWLQCTFITNSTYNVPVRAQAQYPEAFIMMPRITNGMPFTECFLAENRYRMLNDTNNPASGMLIWHVDARRTSGFLYNNSYSSHKLIRLMEADGLEQIENSSSANAGDYYTQGKSLSPYTKPDSRQYDGANPWGGSNTWIKISAVSPNGVVMTANFEFTAFPLVTNTTVMLVDAGDGDGHPEPGENARLWLWLKNIGGGIVSNVVATLTNVSPYLTVAGDASAAYGTLTPDGVKSNAVAIMIAVSNACPAGLQQLRAVIASDRGGWTTSFGVLIEQLPAFRPVQTNVILYAAPDGTDTKTIEIRNDGSSALAFGPAPATTAYVWTSSDAVRGPAFSWIDISTKGTAVAFNDEGAVASANAIGFAMPFYDRNFTQYRIGINGALLLQGALLQNANSNLPTVVTPGAFLPAYWDDLYFSTSDYCVRRWNDANQLVVSYLNIPRKGQNTSPNSFQIIVRKNGEIRYQYRTMSGTLNSATIGVQGTNLPGNSLVVAFNANYVKNNLATSFMPPVPPVAPWLSCLPTNVSVPVGTITTLTFFANAAGLVPGVYTTSIAIAHNDPDAPLLQVPVWLVVPEPAGVLIAFVLLVRRGGVRIASSAQA